MIKMVMEQEKSKFYLVTPQNEALFNMSSCPSKRGRIDFKFVDCIYGCLIQITMIGFEENSLFWYITKKLNTSVGGARKCNMKA